MNSLKKFVVRVGRKMGSNSDQEYRPAEDAYGKTILSLQEGNDVIAHFLETPGSLMTTRLGAVELRCLVNYVQILRYRNSKRFVKYLKTLVGHGDIWLEDVKKEMANNAGFFPATDRQLERFCVKFLNHIADIDVLGVWFRPYEDYFFKLYFPHATLVPLRSLEPYYHCNPWSKNLANKKVLVVHPFEESIARQYGKRKMLFRDEEVLPEFELQTMRAVQSIAGNVTPFRDWFEAYDFMCRQIESKDFDVAIIGAGAYGLPLASFVKQLGKKAIHLGGATQILFGIKGRRWDSHEFISKLYNEYWVKPLPSEVPSNYLNVEQGCYW